MHGSQKFPEASILKRLTSREIKEEADRILSDVFKHKKYKTEIQKQAIYTIARSECIFFTYV